MTTVPVPLTMKGPMLKVMDPVDESAVIVTGSPTKLGRLDWVTVPVRVTVVPVTEPVSRKLHTPGLGLGWTGTFGGGASVPSPDNDEGAPEACAPTVTRKSPLK